MTITSLGDLAIYTQNLRSTGSIKDRLSTLSQELSTGLTSDLVAETGGSTSRIDSVNRELESAAAFLANNRNLESQLLQTQSILGEIDQRRTALANEAALMTGGNAGQPIGNVAANTRREMSAIVNMLNSTHTGAALFAGRATNAQALIDADAMLADIATTLTPLSTAEDIRTAVDDWFDGPTGFATIGYTGDNGALASRKVSSTDEVTLDARANDPAVVALLKSLAGVAVVDFLGSTVPETTTRDVVEDRLDELFATGAGIVDLRARIGTVEEKLTRANVSLEAQTTALSLELNDRTTVDQFETASLLQEVQRQLELHFTSTSRLSRLSLVNYL